VLPELEADDEPVADVYDEFREHRCRADDVLHDPYELQIHQLMAGLQEPAQ